jgi:heterodisulfide reductase subunit A
VKNIIIIGGGIAGIEVASSLSAIGYEVTLMEKNSELGGKLQNYDCLFPNFRPASDIKKYIFNKCSKNGFDIYTNTEIIDISRKNGKFLLRAKDNKTYRSDAVVLTTGFDFFDARKKEEYGYKIYENVLTSVDLEEKFKSGEKITTSIGNNPKRIAFIHCVGSRDEKSGHHYCSKVCCITGVKQAIELSERLPEAEIFCFYMDLRMYDQGYEELYRSAQENYNIQFIRGRLSEASENLDESLLIKAEDTLSGRPLKMNVDLLILLIGMEPGAGTVGLARSCNLVFDSSGFIKTKDAHTHRNLSSEKGIFLAGACSSPMSVNDTLENARSAVIEIHNYFNGAD